MSSSNLVSALYGMSERIDRPEWAAKKELFLQVKPAELECEGELVKRFCQGKRDAAEELSRSFRPRELRFFLSSTFTDTEVERNLVMEDIIPFLKQCGEPIDVSVHAASEMRWGIRSAASARHETAAICMEEIHRCQKDSGGVSYVVLLGDRYGFRPFPAVIAKDELPLLLNNMSTEGQEAVTEWYVLDENASPAVYMLKPLLDERMSDIFWKSSFPLLQSQLRFAARGAQLPESRVRYFEQSVTAEEIFEGLEKRTKEQRGKECIYIRRRFLNPSITPGDDRSKQYMDLASDNKPDESSQEMLIELRDKRLTHLIEKEQWLDFTVPWKAGGIDPTHLEHREYLKKFADALCDRLLQSMEETVKIPRLPRAGIVAEVMAHTLHLHKASQSACIPSHLPILNHLDKYLSSPSQGKSFAIRGQSGAGKSTFIAHSINLVQDKYPDAVVAYRFLGTTNESRQVRLLMTSLEEQLRKAWGLPPPSLQKDLKGAIGSFNMSLKMAKMKGPVYLFLDALDQMEETDEAHFLEWLPLASLPEKVWIIVSYIDGFKNISTSVENALAGNSANMHLLPPLHRNECRETFHLWMANRSRTLTSSQLQLIHDAIDTSEARTPLFLRLLVDIAAPLCSYDALQNISDPSVSGLLDLIFARLEERHGKVFVQRAAALICASRDGISSMEMEHVLSLDDDVLDEVYEWWTPPRRCLPSLLWTRLSADLGWFLVKREGDNRFKWFHRQLSECIARKYCEGENFLRAHRYLGSYYAGRYVEGKEIHGKGPKVQRHVPAMKTIVTGRVDDGSAIVQDKKLQVVGYHLALGEEWELLQDVFCDLDFLIAAALIQPVRDFMADVHFIRGRAQEANILSAYPALNNFTAFLLRESENIHADPQCMGIRAALFRDADGPVATHARERFESGMDKRAMPVCLGGGGDQDGQAALLTSHKGPCKSLALSGNLIVMGGHGAVLFLHPISGQVVAKLPFGKSEYTNDSAVDGVAVNPQGTLLAATCRDMFRMWRLDTYAVIQDAPAPREWGYKRNMQWSANGCYVSTSGDGGSPACVYSDSGVLMKQWEAGKSECAVWHPIDPLLLVCAGKSIILSEMAGVKCVDTEIAKGLGHGSLFGAWNASGTAVAIAERSTNGVDVFYVERSKEGVTSVKKGPLIILNGKDERGQVAEPVAVSFSRSGLLAIGCNHAKIHLFRVTKPLDEGVGSYLHVLSCDVEKHVFDIRWHPQNPEIFASFGWDHRVRVWEVEEEKKQATQKHIMRPSHQLDNLQWAPWGSSILVASMSEKAEVFDYTLAAREEEKELNYYSLQWSPDGRMLATGDGEGGVTLWDGHDLHSPPLMKTIRVTEAELKRKSQQKKASQSTSATSNLRTLQVNIFQGDKATSTRVEGNKVTTTMVYNGITELEWSSDSTVLACASISGDIIGIFFISKGSEKEGAGEGPSAPRKVEADEGEKHGGEEAKGERIFVEYMYLEGNAPIAWSPAEGSMILVGNNISKKGVNVWDMKTRTLLHTVGVAAPTKAITWHPTGQIYAITVDKRVALIDPEISGCFHILSKHTSDVEKLQFSPDGRFLVSTASQDEKKKVLVWSVGGEWQKLCRVKIDSASSPRGVGWAPEGAMLLLSCFRYENHYSALYIGSDYECTAMDKALEYQLSGVPERSCAWSPTGSRFVTVANNLLYLNCIVDGMCSTSILRGHSKLIRGAAFAPVSPTRLASAGIDGTVKVWQFSQHDSLGAAEKAAMEGVVGESIPEKGREQKEDEGTEEKK